MEISQLLPANGTSSAPKSSQGAKTDSEDFAQMLKQSGEAANGKKLRNEDAASNRGNDSLAKAANDNEAVTEAPDDAGNAEPLPETATTSVAAAVAETLARTPGAGAPATGSPAAGSPAAGLSPLTQNIAQAMSIQQGAGTQDAALKATQAVLNGSETFDLAAIRERLTTIANAQRGTTTASTPAAAFANTLPNAGQAAMDVAKASLPNVSDRIASLQGQSATSLHQQLATQGMGDVSTQNPASVLPSAGQPTTFMDAIATQQTTADLSIAARSSNESHASQAQAFAGNLTGASGSASQTQGASAQVLNAPLATPQWQQGLGQQVVSLHQRGAQQMELHLRPADLGPLTISLKVDDQLAQLQLFSTNPQVRAAIEQAIPQLREALEESGIKLGETMVGEHRHQGDDGTQSGDAALASLDGDSQGASTDEELDLAATGARSLADNGNAVDLYA